MKPSPDSKWIDSETAAAHLGVSLDVFYGLVASKHIAAVRVGRRAIRTTRALCDAYLERQLMPENVNGHEGVQPSRPSVLVCGAERNGLNAESTTKPPGHGRPARPDARSVHASHGASDSAASSVAGASSTRIGRG
jgi:excisionase family DNA binding protein